MQYEVNDDTDSVQMLQRSTQVGEFYRMAAPKVLPKDDTGAPITSGGMYDIVIYDEEMDKHVHITIREALKAAMQGLLTGPKTTANSFPFFGPPGDGEWQKKNMAPGMDVVPDGLSADQLAEALEKGGYHPVEVIVARPFIEHMMMSAIMTVAGRDTGSTLFGPADMCATIEHVLARTLLLHPSTHHFATRVC